MVLPPNSKSKTSLKVNKEILDKNSCSICGKKITNNDCFLLIRVLWKYVKSALKIFLKALFYILNILLYVDI